MTAKKVTSVKTLRNWEEEFKIKFDYDLYDGKENRKRCQP